MYKYQPTRDGQCIGEQLSTKEAAETIIKRDEDHSQVCADLGWITQEQHNATRWYVVKVKAG